MILFVYGSLKRGRSNHGFLKNCEFLGEAYTSNDYTLIVSGLPYLVERSGEGCRGELYKVPSGLLKNIDRLEGHPDFYERKPIITYLIDTNEEVFCEAYIHPDTFGNKFIKNYVISRNF